MSEGQSMPVSDLSDADVLRRARDLIEDPENWLQGDFECNGRRCASGAILTVVEADTRWGYADVKSLPAYRVLQRAMGTARSVCDWNDQHTHAEVLEAFDRAIAVAEGADHAA